MTAEVYPFGHLGCPRDGQAGKVKDACALALAGDALAGGGCGLALGEDLETTETDGQEGTGGGEADRHWLNSIM